MSNFDFNDTKNFSENCHAFLDHLKSEDQELADILIANWTTLLAVVSQGERNPSVRTEFNKAIALALDSIIEAEGS